jgi:hypothetical protein
MGKAKNKMKKKNQTIHVVFKDDYSCVINYPEGKTTLHFREPDWDDALNRLVEMNQRQTVDGKPLSTTLSWKGFYVWWFGQDYLLRGILLPVMQYKSLIDFVFEHKGEIKEIIVSNSPKRFALYTVPILKRLGIKCSIEGSLQIVLQKLQEFIGFCLKLAVSLCGIISCVLRPKRILFFTLKPVDPELHCDRRLKDIYEELRKQQIPFTEIVFSISNLNALHEQKLRRRVVIYYRQIIPLFTWLFPKIALPVLKDKLSAPIEQAIFGEYWDYTISRLRQTQILRVLLTVLQPSVLLILDDNREMFSLVTSAKSLNIPVISYQHGMLSKHHVGLFCYGHNDTVLNHGADRYFVWSEYARNRLLQKSRLFTPEQIIVGGHIRRLLRKHTRNGYQENPKIRLLWLGEPLSNINEVKPFIETIVDDKDVELRYRPRPDGFDAKHQAIIHQWRLSIPFSKYTNLDEDLENSDVVIGTYTSVLYECYLHLVPSVILKVPLQFAQDMLEEDWAIVARSPSELKERIKEALALTIKDLVMRQRYIWGDENQLGFEQVVRECERWVRLTKK